ncbi:MAG: S9 family peptidase [Acidimicrobiaceae bacterium]|nr:S9 family peptidase [Acidimicrobiaceae bacterium]
MPNAPRPAARPTEITRHGHTRVDPYFWLRERENPEVIAHLEAENRFVSESLSALEPLSGEIFEEIRSRIEETDTSVPVRRGNWWYFERTREGLSYPVSCRVPALGSSWTPPVIDSEASLEGEQTLLDENREAEGHDFLSVGVFAVSPNDGLLAVGVDFEGDERHRVDFRSLTEVPAPSEVLEDVYYGLAWANDSHHVFYTRVDDAMRPYQVWRHELDTAPALDVLVFEESDALYNVSVGRSRDSRVLVIAVGSSTTSEYWWLDADRPLGEWRVVEARRTGVEYSLEHALDTADRPWWLMTTNESATDFRLVARPREGSLWREIIAHRPGVRLEGVDAFRDYWAISERREGSAAVRLVPLGGVDIERDDLSDAGFLVEESAAASTVVLGANATFDAPVVRVVTTSLSQPRRVLDVDVNSRLSTLLKEQRVLGGYDASAYISGRVWVTASDGVRIPVSVLARRGVLVEDSAGELVAPEPAPLLLYGYGAYEISIDPSFSSLRLSLVDRGVIFAIAHVRGGGEMGRSWYEMGRLAQKPTTFSDFVRVAEHLVATGWTEPHRLAVRGGSAGGLLMGAVMNLAPHLLRAVVAEVPFVDVVTTMLDASLPLTVGEWEEWGNPDADPVAYRTMLSYSPYDNLRPADDATPRYPRLFATGGLNDSRVGFWEPAKWVARLRDLHPEAEVYLKMEMGAGHGGASGRYDAWRDEAQILAFILDSIRSTP